MNRVIAVLLGFLLFSCNTPFDQAKGEDGDKPDSGDENTSQTVMEMPKELEEISGISFFNDNEFLAIEDETGTLYFYDIVKKSITNSYSFAGPGDYEDVAIAGNDVYIVNSGGDIYEIKNYKADHSKTTIYNTGLKKKNDIEGLAYDEKNGRLLLASKAKGLDKESDDKHIYAFDLKTKKLNPTPAFTIALKQIEEYFEGDAVEESSKKFLKALGNENMKEIFRSSAITIDSRNQNILVLSSINDIVAVLTPDGKLSRIISLKGKFRQPEGISFTPSGKLYVSNEGSGKKANIIEIDYAN